MSDGVIELRASGLPGHMDCSRKWAFQTAIDPRSKLGPVFQRHGFTLPDKKRDGIGAAVGKACHEAFGNMLQARLDGYEVNPEQVAIGKFRKLDEAGIDYDTGKVKVTADKETAEAQIKRMVAEFLPHALQLQPKRLEFKLEAMISSEYLLSGHPDYLGVQDDIRDFKFGKTASEYRPQLGAYSLMYRSNGGRVTGLFVDHLARNSIKSAQKPLEQLEYSVPDSELSAHYVLDYAMTQIEKFKETGNPWVFPANPNTLLCSKKWCPAWGTEFCTLGKPEKQSEE